MTEAQLREALRDCYDPVTRHNIVDAGLVRAATLTRDAEFPGPLARFIAHITLTAPGSDEDLNEQLSAQIANRLAGFESISRTEVTFLPPLFPMLK